MAIIGTLGSYNQTVGVKVDMDPLIDILDPRDVTLQQLFENGEPAHSTKVEWLNEELTGQEVTVNTTSATGNATIVLNSGEGTLIRVGDILALKNDANTNALQVHVTAVSTDTLTVTRPFASSTDKQLVANDVLTLIGQYLVEGDDPKDGRAVDRTTDYNYTQIGQEQVKATRTTRKVARYGMADPYDHEVEKKFKELSIRQEKRMILGRRLQSGDAKQRAMGGLFFYITSHTESNTSSNLETAFRNLQKKCWGAGGAPTDLVVSPEIKAQFDILNEDRVRETRADGAMPNGRKLGDIATTYASSYGTVRIHMDRYMPKTKAVLVQPDFIKHRVMDGWFHELLAKTGDSVKGEIVGERSLEVKNEKAHGILTITDVA